MAMQGHHRSTKEEKSQLIANVVHLGTSCKVDVFHVTTKNSAWIIDTWATDYMTNDSTKLQTFKSSSQSDISIPNGSTSLIIGDESIFLSNMLALDTVLVVPKHSYNLLSVCSNTSTLNCIVTFLPSFF